MCMTVHMAMIIGSGPLQKEEAVKTALELLKSTATAVKHTGVNMNREMLRNSRRTQDVPMLGACGKNLCRVAKSSWRAWRTSSTTP